MSSSGTGTWSSSVGCSPIRSGCRSLPCRSCWLAASYAARCGSSVIVLLAVALVDYIAWTLIARQRFMRKIRIARITPAELKTRLAAGEDMMVVDLRHRVDFEAEPSIIPGGLHLTTEELEARHLEIPRDREIVLYCT